MLSIALVCAACVPVYYNYVFMYVCISSTDNMWVLHAAMATILIPLIVSEDESYPHQIKCREPSGVCHVPLLAFVPCLHGNTSIRVAGGGVYECDVFVHAAILQAVEDVNRNGSFVRRNGHEERINVRLQLSHIATEVRILCTSSGFGLNIKVAVVYLKEDVVCTLKLWFTFEWVC